MTAISRKHFSRLCCGFLSLRAIQGDEMRTLSLDGIGPPATARLEFTTKDGCAHGQLSDADDGSQSAYPR
jgi:hypothetical protein